MANAMQVEYMVKRGIEIKREMAELKDELDEIVEQLEASGSNRLAYEDGSEAVRVVQVRKLFSQSEAIKLLGAKAARCFYDVPVMFWKFEKR